MTKVVSAWHRTQTPEMKLAAATLATPIHAISQSMNLAMLSPASVLSKEATAGQTNPMVRIAITPAASKAMKPV
jgi:hypothetical protein